jgi:hypothetical protein
MGRLVAVVVAGAGGREVFVGDGRLVTGGAQAASRDTRIASAIIFFGIRNRFISISFFGSRIYG